MASNIGAQNGLVVLRIVTVCSTQWTGEKLLEKLTTDEVGRWGRRKLLADCIAALIFRSEDKRQYHSTSRCRCLVL